MALDVWEKVFMPLVACPECGAPTARAFITKAAAVIGDEMDQVITHGVLRNDPHREADGTRRFRSKLEHARWLKDNGYRIKDTGLSGQSAAIMDAVTLDNARFLVTHRALGTNTGDEPDEPLHFTPYDEITGVPI